MKLYSEDEALKAAGKATLEPDEVIQTAEDMVRRNVRVIAFAIMENKPANLRAMLRQHQQHTSESKALEAWKKSTGAVWDVHRGKFIVWEQE